MTLSIGVPSKGRLQDNSSAFFARAGLGLTRARGARGYRGALDGLPGVEVHYLSAADIAGDLATGKLHIGITGEDLIREAIPETDAAVNFLMPLGFGFADVVVAVPEAWIDVDTIADLDDISITMRAEGGRVPRIATKYLNLTRRYFATHGMMEFRDYRLVESSGATEGTPASGAADLIVDITTSGATLAANGLKILSDGVILKSQANLVASLRADWGVMAKEALAKLLIRVEAEARGRMSREITVEAHKAQHAALLAVFGDKVSISSTSPTAISGVVPEAGLFALIDRLRAAGGNDISVRRTDYVFSRESDIFAGFVKKIDG